ncbi:MAG: Adaptor for signal transduction [Peltula sp. TS41687]|nr:MAG: Adaptor for signal transduction [Peltula sp. TS41687]
MAFTQTYEDSDADDEYERGMASPPLVTDSEASPTDSDPPSAENTPTTYGHLGDEKLPRTIISEWTAEECADFVSSLGLSQYADAFLENEIVGEALVALKHDELKEMGMASVGHRLTLLKSVYDIKIKQDIPIESEHYVPLSADAGMQDATATQEDIARIIQSIRLRDERIVQAEQELRRVTEEYRRLREELLPVFRMAKDRSQPLPFHPTGSGNDMINGDHQVGILSSSQSEGLSRKFSHKKFFLGSTPQNSSPTYVPSSIQDKYFNDGGTIIDPSLAAQAVSSHLTASVGGGGPAQPSSTSPSHPNIPSPTSPPPNFHPSQSPLIPRTYQQPPRSQVDDDRDRSNPTPNPSRRGDFPPPHLPTLSGDGQQAPSAEIFKSFRVSMDDPCHKVLPAALKKYNINADWKQYALYIVYGDEERCLELEEKPLILFKQLDREGRKPTFMLRKIAATSVMDGTGGGGMGQLGSGGLMSASTATLVGNGGQLMGNGGVGRGTTYQTGVTLPGGVL